MKVTGKKKTKIKITVIQHRLVQVYFSGSSSLKLKEPEITFLRDNSCLMKLLTAKDI